MKAPKKDRRIHVYLKLLTKG